MNVLHDAVKREISMPTQALLQWDFKENGYPRESHQLPEQVVDQILKWRDRDREADGGRVV